MMDIEILHGELERLFELDELLRLSESVLGFEPDTVGGTSAKGSFAGSLTKYCVEHDALEALCDAVLAIKSDASPKLAELRLGSTAHDDDLRLGDALGPFTIVRKIGEGRLGVTYLARKGERDFRLKLLRSAAVHDRRGLQRFLTVVRVIAGVEHAGLPKQLIAERAGHRVYMAHEYVEGQALSARINRTGPMHINEARDILRAVLEPLQAIHQRRLAHGDLRLENLITYRDAEGQPKVLLLDAGADRLRVVPNMKNGHAEFFAGVLSPRTVAPEQVRGLSSDPRSDVYSFGALLYEVLSGKPLFADKTPLLAAVAHLTEAPAPPSSVAPRGWVSSEVDDFVLALLARDPEKRPQNAAALLEALDRIGKSDGAKPEVRISDEDLDQRCEALKETPLDGEAALKLEASVDEGADPLRVGEVFAATASELDAGDDDAKKSAKKNLLFRAARLFQNRAKTPDKAEQIYVALLELDPEDEIATAALEDVRRQLGKYEELIEMLVVRGEGASDSIERARAFAEIGGIYKDDLDDEEQAVVAFTQAFCADPEHHEYADLIERHAKKRAETWNEVLGVCAQAVSDESLSVERKHALLLTMGRWYGEKLQRTDLALPCLQAVLQDDPAHQTALEAMTQIYRKSLQWPELVLVLMRRADATVVASRGRELKAEAAEVLEHQLNDTGGARDLYEQILAADPFHAKASAALAKIYERTGDFAGQVRILESRLLGLRGDEKLREMCRIAEVYEDRLNDNEEAIRRYQAVVADDANHLEALRGLDRLFSKVGRYRELLENLKAQAALAVTPRQKITFWERAAAIHDEEFLDHRQAAEALEKVLEIDAAHEASILELVRHYRALDRWEDVTALYERQLKLVTAPEQRVEILLSLGRVFSEQIGSPERATGSYERVLEINPEHAGALEALARLRESAGDADLALKAIEALAVKATTPEAKAEQYLRAAKLLEGRGDRDGAVERYKMALDANPKDTAAALALRSAYLARGDVNAAMQLLDREIQQTDGDRAKAKLAGEMALLARDRLKDDKRAKEAAERALTFDPTNLDALTILGDLAFDAKRHLEAARHYEVLAERAATLDKREAARILVRFVDALSQTGSTEKALAPMDTLLRIAPDDLEALERVAYVTFEHGSPKRAVELYADILERFTDKLVGTQRAGIVYRYGEALRLSEQYEKALGFLEESADLDPSNPAPLVALAKAHEARSDWEQVVKTKSRHLDLANGDERVQLLVEIGEVASSKLNDRTQAAKNFVAALDERPDDRRLLGKLMQLYSEEKDWNKLVEVVLRLAEFVDDPKQKAKYLHTAANITGRQIGDAERALEYYEQALALDGTMDKALDEAIELQRDRGEHRAVEPLLKRRLDRATAAKDEGVMLATFSELGELYEKKLGWVNEAIDAFEAAQTLDPDNRERAAHLAQLYITDPEKYLDKAVASQEAILRQNPYRPESYKLLRRLYTEVKRADAAWCLCQGLFVLNLAEPDEERFFKRMRSDTAAAAQQALTDEDWLRLVMHPDADPLLTSVFALIEPAVIGRRGQSLEELGYDPRYAIDLSMHPYPMSQTLHYAAGVLGMDPPPTFQNTNDPGGLSFLHAHAPSIVLGVAALSANVPPQAAAFIAARHLTYFRPGMYLRHLVPTFTGLKSWLFAAIKLNAPQFPVSPDLEGPVREAVTALEAGLPGQTRDHLSRVVSKLIQSGAALDLKKWVAGVDLTADRAGTIVAHDLETAAEIIKASEEGSSAVPNQDRLKELVLYAVSEPYFELRQTLGIAIDS